MIEHLEARIAPAAVITFTEVDGDKIKIATSKGTKAELIAAFNAGVGDKATGIDSIALDLTTTTDFAGSNLAISVLKKAKGGDGLADDVTITGYSATLADGHSNIFLNNVTVQGNLTAISAGDDSTLNAINKLTVSYWGPVGDPDTFLAEDATVSTILGGIKSILVKSDFNGYLASATDYTATDTDGVPTGTVIGSFVIKGNIASYYGNDVGHIRVGEIDKLTVGGTFFGPGSGEKTNNGLIEAAALYTANIGAMGEGAKIDIFNTAAPVVVS